MEPSAFITTILQGWRGLIDRVWGKPARGDGDLGMHGICLDSELFLLLARCTSKLDRRGLTLDATVDAGIIDRHVFGRMYEP